MKKHFSINESEYLYRLMRTEHKGDKEKRINITIELGAIYAELCARVANIKKLNEKAKE